MKIAVIGYTPQKKRALVLYPGHNLLLYSDGEIATNNETIQYLVIVTK